jgi:glycosyltransferase involved in cell wall biosynthesis
VTSTQSAPRATVLMSVYNERVAFLDQAVASALGQTLSEFELLIIDDGSTNEETRSALGQWEKSDPRVRLIRSHNQGLTRALNLGLREARAPIVVRHDSDDWSASERLDEQLHVLESEPELALVGTSYHLCSEVGDKLFPVRLPASHEAILRTFRSGSNPFCHGSVAFRRAAILALGGYRESLPCAQDHDLFWRVSERWPTKNLGPPLYYHRRTGGSVSVSKAQLQDTCSVAIRLLGTMRAAGRPEDFASAWAEAEQEARTPARQRRSVLRKGDHLMLAGHYSAGLRAYATAFARNPTALAVILKALRLVVFRLFPRLRPRLFRARQP